MTDIAIINDEIYKLAPLRLTLTGDEGKPPTGLLVERGAHRVHLGEGGPDDAHQLETGMPYVADGLSVQPKPLADGKWGHVIEADGHRVSYNLPESDAELNLPGDRVAGQTMVARRGAVARKPAARKSLIDVIKEAGGELPPEPTVPLSLIDRIKAAFRKDSPDPSDVHADVPLTEPHTHVHDHGDGPHQHAHRHEMGKMDDHASHPSLTLKSVLAFEKMTEERRFTLGPQYIPDRVDAHGEFATAEDLQDAVHEYVKSGDRTIYKQHGKEPIGEWVEMMSWPHEVTVDMTVPGQVAKSRVTLPAGTVFMGVEWTKAAWPDVKSGKITGYSMGGFAHRIDVDLV